MAASVKASAAKWIDSGRFRAFTRNAPATCQRANANASGPVAELFTALTSRYAPPYADRAFRCSHQIAASSSSPWCWPLVASRCASRLIAYVATTVVSPAVSQVRPKWVSIHSSSGV